MESLEKRIERFLAVSYGFGSGSGYNYGSGYGNVYGDGYGYGSGSGYGNVYGYGFGYGSGSGYNYGSGYGNVYGDGSDNWKEYNGQKIYYIDALPTLIYSIHGTYAKGAIIGKDLVLRSCFIAKCGNYFAHGDNLRDAVRDAEAKYNENLPLEERIATFREKHPGLDTPYDDLFEWHHTLTGSCEIGRKEWCRTHGYQPTDSITVREFIEGTINEYGRDIIKALAKEYGLEV